MQTQPAKTFHEIEVIPETEVMSQFTLNHARDPAHLEAEIRSFIAQNPLATWVKRWHDNAGNFLQTLAWDQDHDYGNGLIVDGAMGSSDHGGASGCRTTRGLLNAGRLRRGDFDLWQAVRGKVATVVGAWCGYEALLLAGMGATSVNTVEEVPPYSKMCEEQKSAFGIPGVDHGKSMYDLTPQEIQAAQADFVYCPGVLYHCSDSAAALLILRLMTQTGGQMAFETMSKTGPAGDSMYLGPSVMGWNWWCPSSATWMRMMHDVGFEQVRQVDFINGRAWFVGTASPRNPLKESGAAGFSRKDLLNLLP
jgi:hypothetical protein